MRPFLAAATLVALSLAGCATPQAIKDQSKLLVATAPKLTDAHLADLAATEAYVRQTKSSLDALVAEANLRAINIREATDAWQAARVAGYRAQILTQFDEAAFKTMNAALNDKAKEFDARLNTRLKPLLDDVNRKLGARNQNPGSATLLNDYLAAAVQFAQTRDKGNQAFVKAITDLDAALAAARANLVKEIDEMLPGAAAKPAADKIVFTTALASDKKTAAYEPADSLKQIASRRDQVTKTGEALATSLKSIDYYLTTDGYSRVFVKDAIGGFADAVVSPLKAPVKNFLTTKLKLPADVAAKVDSAIDNASQSGQDALFGVFTSLQKKAATLPQKALETFESNLKADEATSPASTAQTAKT